MGAILLLTWQGDAHADLLQSRLADRGLHCHRVNLEKFPGPLELGASSGCLPPHVLLGDQSVAVSNVDAVVLRPIQNPAFWAVDEDFRRFATDERMATLEALFCMLREAFWINDYGAERGASNKFHQLEVARRCGLAVPRSISTNSPDLARKFIHEVPRAVIKAQGHFRVGEHEGEELFLRTESVDASMLEDEDAIRNCPLFLQERLEKKHELRVTIVGDEVFSAVIHSQEANPNPKTALDYRNADYDHLRIEASSLPEETARACRDLKQALDLEACAIDLVVTPSDEHVFLEVNSSPQWYWVEERTGQPITDAYVNLLEQASEKNCHQPASDQPP